MKKRGQAKIITTLLTILIVLTAIVVAWNVINALISRTTGEIAAHAFVTQLEIEGAAIYTASGGGIVDIKRDNTKGELSAIKFIFYNVSGEGLIIEENGTNGHCELPEILETKNCIFGLNDFNMTVGKIGIVPIVGDKIGLEVIKENPDHINV